MKLIVGLGNPGDRYKFTRHNMGFLVVDEMAEEHGISLRRKKFDADMGEGVIDGTPVMMVKPRTYMNRSGLSVGQVVSFFKVDSKSIIVVHDDLDLAFGSVRVKEGGGHGGHKGLISISDALGCKDFLRVRLGIGKPLLKEMVENYVLTPFSRGEIEILPDILHRGSTAVAAILSSGAQVAMCRFNVRRVKEKKEEEGGPCSS
jgi:PTH1 family peptidyl-tRNA hydrolase